MESFCGSDKRTNVAAFDCDKARKYPTKLVLGGKAFAAADAVDNDTFHAALTAATQLDTGDANKLFPINVLRDPNDTSTQNVKGKVGEGVEQVLVEGLPGFSYRVEIGQDLFKRLRKFNKRRVKVFTYDDEENLWGCVNTDGKFAGCEAVFFISGNTQQTSSAPVSALIEIGYISAKQYNDESFYVPVVLTEFEPTGLLDGFLTKVSNVANVYKIDFKAPTAAFNQFLNLSKKYNAQLVAGLYNAKTGATYATNLPITSRAYDATLECETITFDSTAYALLAPGAKIKFYLDPVADLVTAGITGVEGVIAILTVV